MVINIDARALPRRRVRERTGRAFLWRSLFLLLLDDGGRLSKRRVAGFICTTFGSCAAMATSGHTRPPLSGLQVEAPVRLEACDCVVKPEQTDKAKASIDLLTWDYTVWLYRLSGL